LDIEYKCLNCALKSFFSRIENSDLDKGTKNKAAQDFLKECSSISFKQTPPELGRTMHKMIQELTDNPDPFKAEKDFFNKLLFDRYSEFEELIRTSALPFMTALKFAVVGNLIDFGTQKEIDIKDVYKKSESTHFEIDGSSHLHSEIKNADMILYLGDNCGEIVFDKLLISTIKKEFPDKKIIFAVRSAPIINDITIEDAEYVGISELAEVIANGYDAPGTILEFCSDEFLDIYRNADLIISKGQGNYEGLSDETENIFFLLTAKCDVVAESLGAKVGDSIVAHA